MTDIPQPRTVYRVSELVAAARDLLEHSFPLLWVEGEISNLARPRSGHWYFTLKDADAQVRCAMFANRNRLVRTVPGDGDRIQVRARVSLYPARGDFQLIVESLEDAGEGALRRAFEQLRDRLAAEGLFEAERKRPPPRIPRRIGVITSPTGAAIRDVLAVLRRRYPLGRVLVHPVPVQGDAAPSAVVRALEAAGSRADCDVLLLVRGGGSLEDLWAFNDEAVARAVHDSPIPVITGIGHEVDVTIADFAADVRAPTPSAAAELVCPDLGEQRDRALALGARTAAAVQRRLDQTGQRLRQIQRRLTAAHSARRLEQRMQRTDELELRLHRNIRWQVERRRMRCRAIAARLAARHPGRRLEQRAQRLDQAAQRLHRAVAAHLDRARQRQRVAAAELNAVSPLRTLARGYAIVEDEQRRVVTDANELAVGQSLRLRLRHGRVACRVEGRPDDVPDNRDKVER